MELYAANIKTLEELQAKIDEASEYEQISLHGKFEFIYSTPKTTNLSVGRRKPKSIITINKAGISINGSNASIIINITNPQSDISLFGTRRGTEFCQFLSLKIKVYIVTKIKPVNILGFLINGKASAVKNCNLEMVSVGQENMTAIFINGNNDTRFKTDCDYFCAEACKIYLSCSAEDFPYTHSLYGIYNNYSNSLSILNNQIEIITDGNGLKHRAIGIFTSGHYCRINSNNIKASGNHPEAEKIEKPFAIGVENKSSFCVVTGNSIVGERGGKCIGVLNNGYYLTLSGNRIISTHSLNAHSVILNGENASVAGNTITTTGKNSRIIDINCSFNVITGNLLDNYCDPVKALTSCGIFSDTRNKLDGIVICGNIIRRYYNIGLYLCNTRQPEITGNIFSPYEYASDPIESKLTYDELISKKFDESAIKSIIFNT